MAMLPRREAHLHPSQLSAHELLVLGGYVHEAGKGIFSFLPLGMQALRNIGIQIERAMRRLGGQEVLLPVLSPEEPWKTSGRLRLGQSELFRLQDACEGGLVLSPTQELAAFSMFRSMLESGARLPLFIYQNQIKLREDANPGGGLEKAREFLMHDAYSFHHTFTSLNNFIPRVYQTYRQIFADLGLEVVIADGVANHMGGDRSYDFFLPHPRGDYGLVRCPSCHYEANRDVAAAALEVSTEKPLPAQTMVKLDFIDLDTLGRQIGLPRHRMVKARLYWGFDSSILAVFRADQEVSTDKLGKVAGETIIRAATDTEILRLGLDSRHLSPMGLRNRRLEQKGLRVVVDRMVADSPNLTMTVNEEYSYIINANFGRDFDADLVGDITQVGEGYRCRTCNQVLEHRQAYKLANIYRIGEYYSRSFGFTLPGPGDGNEYPSLGAYGINLGRTLVAMVEANRSPRGFLWPPDFAPYKASLIPCGLSSRIRDLADSIHERNSDILLYEDGPESFLSRIRRTDRLGIPLRIILTQSGIQRNQVAIIDARTRQKAEVAIKDIRAYVMEISRKDQDSHAPL